MKLQYRFTIQGKQGIWRDYEDGLGFMKDCGVFAENEVDFAVEFRKE